MKSLPHGNDGEAMKSIYGKSNIAKADTTIQAKHYKFREI